MRKKRIGLMFLVAMIATASGCGNAKTDDGKKEVTTEGTTESTSEVTSEEIEIITEKSTSEATTNEETSEETASEHKEVTTDASYNEIVEKDDKIWGSWVTEQGTEFIFKSDKSYGWFQNSEEHHDNFYRGTTEVLKGLKATEELGIGMDQVMNLIVNSEGKVGYSDIYAVKCHPTYLISGGVDKTDTLTKEFDMTLLMIVVDDHEAQGYNYTTGDTYYFVRN